MKRFAQLLLLAAVFAFFTGFSVRSTLHKAPNFKLQTLRGRTIELSQLKGKTVVINFWATWCGPCRAEIPGFIEVYEKYKSKGLEIVGVSVDEGGWSDVKPFVKEYKIDYPVVLATKKVEKEYGNIDAIPTTFIVDKNGFIVDRHLGYLKMEDFEKRIEGYL